MRAALIVSVVSVAALFGCGRDTVVLGPGSIEERVVARAVVASQSGTAEVSTGVNGRVVSISREEGDAVEAGDELAEVEARFDVAPTPVVAPIGGVVVERRVDVGDDVSSASGPLFDIADPTALRLLFEIEDADADRVSVGAHVRVVPAGGGATLGETTIASLAPSISERRIAAGDVGTGDRRLVRRGVATLAPGDGLLLGREVEAVIELPARTVEVRCPHEALEIVDGHAVVYECDGLLRSARPVEIGASDAEWVEVIGVAAGTRVCVTGGGS